VRTQARDLSSLVNNLATFCPFLKSLPEANVKKKKNCINCIEKGSLKPNWLSLMKSVLNKCNRFRKEKK
jgi:hypothetical protein